VSVLFDVFAYPEDLDEGSGYFGAFLALLFLKPSSSLESECSRVPNGLDLWVVVIRFIAIYVIFQ